MFLSHIHSHMPLSENLDCWAGLQDIKYTPAYNQTFFNVL